MQPSSPRPISTISYAAHPCASASIDFRHLYVRRQHAYMKIITAIFIIAFVLHASPARAEGGCPPGMIPHQGTDISSCAPIPNYNQSSEQQQTGPRWVSRWGAIATDSNKGSFGASTGMPNRREAEKAALADCKSDGGNKCRVETWYRNSCAAMVVGHNGHNSGNAATLAEAKKAGLKVCEDAGDSNCHVYYAACSPPMQVQ